MCLQFTLPEYAESSHEINLNTRILRRYNVMLQKYIPFKQNLQIGEWQFAFVVKKK